ncbi:MAG: arabinose efflux permease [Halorubrum sp. J07HR59]|nr:MAG: arabinose efflux permease [Halorubrum sp. J07HR59]
MELRNRIGWLPANPAPLYIIFACSLVGVMGVSLISPVLPALRPIFGVSDSQVGLLITAYTLPGVLLGPAVGIIADRFGRKRTVIPLLFLFGIAGAGIVGASSFRQVLVLRVLQGVGGSALITLSVALIGDLYAPQERAALLGVNGSMISTGAAGYPLLGGLLAGLRWSAPFAFFGVGVGVGVAALVILPTSDRDNRSSRRYLSALASELRTPAVLGWLLAVFVALFLFYGAVLTSVPLVLSDGFEFSPTRIGPLLSLVALSGGVTSSQYGRLAGRYSRRRLLAVGFGAYAGGLSGLWMAQSAAVVGVALSVFGIGNAIIITTVDSGLIEAVADDLRAGILGVRTGVFRLGQTLGPVGFTAAAETVETTTVAGYRISFLYAGIAAGICAAYILLSKTLLST